MWIPKNESEIQTVVTSGALEESATFDAKRDVPNKSIDIAKDVAAMANDGGVIIFGIGEDNNKRLTILNPVPLAGAAERIDSIVRTTIAEPPIIQIVSIPTESDPSLGFIVIVIPPSERAPHMVVVKGENRFYGRSDKSNQPLIEGEVARLYERRHRWKNDRDTMLTQEIDRYGIDSNPDFAYLYLVACPVVRDGNLLKRTAFESSIQNVLQELVEKVSSPDVFPTNFAPPFRPPNNWQIRVEGYFGHLEIPPRENDKGFPRYMLDLQIDFDGGGHLFCGRVAERYDKHLVFFPEGVAGHTIRFLMLLGELYARTSFYGVVDLGIALTGLKGCVLQKDIAWGTRRTYHSDEYRKTLRVSAIEIKENPRRLAQDLVMPLLTAISQGQLNPFQNLNE